MKKSKQKSARLCTLIKKILSDSLDGTPVTDDSREHLQRCENCRNYLTQITAIHKEALLEKTLDVPGELKINIMNKIVAIASEKKEKQKLERFMLFKATFVTTITLIPLVILIAGFPLNDFLPLSFNELPWVLSDTIELIPLTLSFAAELAHLVTESFLSLIPTFSTSIWLPLISPIVLLTLVLNLFLITKGSNFQLPGERRTIHGFI
jgi:hypothetical protein